MEKQDEKSTFTYFMMFIILITYYIHMWIPCNFRYVRTFSLQKPLYNYMELL